MTARSISFIGAWALVSAITLGSATPLMAESDDRPALATQEAAAFLEDPVLDALRQRRLVLDAREEELEVRALELKAVERRIEERITVLGNLADQVKNSLARQESIERSRLRGLARSYEAMRPEDAAALLDGLDPALRVAIARYMRQAKLGPVMARMAPENARLLTVGIAENRTMPGEGS